MKRHIFTFFTLVVLTTGCSTAQNNTYNQDIYDPFEETNRKIFAFNQGVDKAVINPVIRGYRTVTPKPARTGLSNFLRHLKSPVTFANQALQGDVNGAKNVALRATINTFVGFGGLMDTAGMEGIPYEDEDFGQTLAVWGLGHGPYLVVPFFGGISARDGTGLAVDIAMDPLNHYVRNIDEDHLNYYRAGLSYLDLRNNLYDALQDLTRNSFDPYASVRSAYYQRRAALVADIGNGMRLAPNDAFDEYY